MSKFKYLKNLTSHKILKIITITVYRKRGILKFNKRR